MLKKLLVFISLMAVVSPVFAIGVTIVAAVASAAFAATFAGAAIAMAINMVVATIISKAFFNANQPDIGGGAGSSPNPGNRQQIPPATDNKLPVVYGSAYVGGTVTDLSISSNNQELYYVISICEVTNTNAGQTADSISFGNIYFGGKLVQFQGNGYTVASLLDESTGVQDTTVNGKIQIFLYRNGSNSPVNSSQSAISVMQTAGLTYTWDNSKLMTNCAFAILHLSYSQSANIRGLEQTKFQVINPRNNTGDCITDYLVNTRYGCAIPPTQLDTVSLTNLTNYSNQSFTYITYEGATATQPRFKFNGVLETNRSVMDNLQDMASCCDCLIKYNEVQALWGVIVQSPITTYAMDINDSNMISAIQITPLDIAASYNVVECKFPDETNQDAFNSSTFDLAEINPALLYPNEPVNKMSISLPLVNNDVQAQYIANRILKASREDLQIQVSVNFVGVQLDSGDVVTVTNTNYGWSAKPFRINKVIQQFNDDGSISVQLNMSEYNSTVYDDVNITQFTPAPNSGIGDPTFFGIPIAPVVLKQYPTAVNPYFTLRVQTTTYGITQYAEIWYSAFANPLQEQMYFGGTSDVQSNGSPWGVGFVLPTISLQNIPTGDWYIFSRMVNSLASSAYSAPSQLLKWRPTTLQFSDRYLSVAYADDISGDGFSFSQANKSYYGLYNQEGTNPPTDPTLYSWYLANPDFDTTKYLLFSNRTGRKFSFATGFAAYAGGTATFVPTSTLQFDSSIWSGLPAGVNSIDLDARTGQVTQTGTTTVGTGELSVINNPNGTIKVALQQYLDFGGPQTKTSQVAALTVDVYGRVVGFQPPDDFFYTLEQFVATSGQTLFNVTRDATYILDQCFVFKNGLILDPTEYTDTAGATGTVTLAIGAVLDDQIGIISFRSYNSATGVYPSFTRNIATLTNQSIYTPTTFNLVNGFELLFLNGTIISSQDYDTNDQDIYFIDNATGLLQVIQWSPNNLSVPNGIPVNIDAFTVPNQRIYPFQLNQNAVNIYNDGVRLVQGTDFTVGTGSYTLTIPPFTSDSILVQQTFSRTGPA